MSRSSIVLVDSSLHIWRDTETDTRKDYAAILKFIETIGFTHRQCEDTAKNYPTLAKDNRRAEHGRLKLRIKRMGIHLELAFYQNENTENRHGGEYDFSRVAKMPYPIRLRWVWACRRIVAFFEGRGLTYRDNNHYSGPDPLEHFNRMWQANRFDRGPHGFPSDKELKSWDRKNGDGEHVNQGDIQFVQDRYRWVRVQVYGGINGMWFGWSNGRLLANVNVGRLRSRFPGRGRQADTSAKQTSLQRKLDAAVKDARYLDAHRFQQALAGGAA